MDLNLSDEQRLLRESADRFVAETFTAEHRKKTANEPLGFSQAIWKQFAELGWLALPISEAHGGLGGGAIEIGILMEAFGRGLVAERRTQVEVGVLHRGGAGGTHRRLSSGGR